MDRMSSNPDRSSALPIAVVGGGPIGIYIALLLARRGERVCLIEAGGEHTEGPYLTQSMYDLLSPSALPAAAHRLGGGGRLWMRRVGEFRGLDFESLPPLRASRWPFEKVELDRFYRAAYVELGLVPMMDDDFLVANVSNLIKILPSSLELNPFRFAKSDSFSRMVEELKEFASVQILTNTFCEKILENDSSGNRHVELNFEGKRDISTFSRVVIAAGCMQSTALLLRSSVLGTYPGFQLIGKGLMEHMDGFIGRLRIRSRRSEASLASFALDANRFIRTNSCNFGVGLRLSEDRSKDLGLPNLHLEIVARNHRYTFDPNGHGQGRFIGIQIKGRHLSKLVFLCERILRGLSDRCFLAPLLFLTKSKEYSVWLKAEEVSFHESILTLDANNPLRLVYLHRISSVTLEGIRRGLQAFSFELNKARLGRLRVYKAIMNSKDEFYLRPNWHPMGTVRLGTSREDSCCDENLMLHESGNVFVVGPAVFPTSSNANPVFTGMALAGRLADHIHSNLIE